MNNKAFIEQTINKIKKNLYLLEEKNAIVGFDGFRDNLVRPIKQRTESKVIYYDTITEYAKRIQSAAGLSGMIEIQSQEVKLGGNAPIMTNSLGKMGLKEVTCIGALGYPQPLEVFKRMPGNCRLLSVSNPGMTDAYEFSDGKIICVELSSLHSLNYDAIISRIGKNTLSHELERANLIAFVDWVNLTQGTDIWDSIEKKLLPGLKLRPDVHFFFDLADPTKKGIDEIQHILKIISRYKPYGEVTLGLNENETVKVWLALHNRPLTENEAKVFHDEVASLEEAGEYIFDKMDIDTLIIHPTHKMIAVTKEGVFSQNGRVVKQPLISTGGGDNLNAGYCLGRLLNLSVEDSLITGMANSGSYVENGGSSTPEALLVYLNKWKDEL
ncbi:MAG: hypothetical protein PUB21_07570 [Bacteroidales bacterium]|nr:hypothetical protein [Bacteroidales bacterium]